MRRSLIVVSTFFALAAGAVYWWVLRTVTPAPQPAAISVTTALGGGQIEGYRRAFDPRPFQFPQDHGPHPGFRNEWWYITGNLETAENHRFGYQLTLFRIALAPDAPASDSAWRSHTLYMGHFAVTDIGGGRHHGFERLSRAALGLAGARAPPFRVWLDNWSLQGTSDDIFPMQVRAKEQGIAIELTLDSSKPLILQGERGLSQKSAEAGNASYYYSYTRLPTHGTVRLGNKVYNVTGTSWLDREWSTSALGPQQTGWDWFALQLDDGRDLMFYRLRHKQDGIDSYSSGVLVDAAGKPRRLRREDIVLRILKTWTSPVTNDRYPIAWRLEIPSAELDLTVTPGIEDQEMRLSVRYWEGAVEVRGTSGGEALTGRGYLEMTRYETPPRTTPND